MHRRMLALVALAVVVSTTWSAAANAVPQLPITVSSVVDVSRDQTAQNETPIAINPARPANMITGANDWNLNDGCAVSATNDGGTTWTPTFPNGFVPGITRFTDDPLVAGTGAYDAGGDPSVAFSPDGKTAYFVCQAFDLSARSTSCCCSTARTTAASRGSRQGSSPSRPSTETGRRVARTASCRTTTTSGSTRRTGTSTSRGPSSAA